MILEFHKLKLYKIIFQDALNNSELLFNLQLLCFIDIENIEDFYKKIVKAYKENKYKIFFNYFKKTWLGQIISKKL